MKVDIILAGVGGQGILSIAAVIGHAAIGKKLFVKQSETHGMSQRGGAVVAHLRIADYPVSSDLIPLGKADLILAVEPLEALRYLPFLSAAGYVVTNTVPFVNIPNYPDLKTILAELNKLRQVVLINADELAVSAGNIKASNMVIAGAASPLLHIEENAITEGISQVFASKGREVIELNIKAFKAGRDYAWKS